MVELTKMALCTGRAQKQAGAVRLHGGEQLSKEAMSATQLFSAFVGTCLLSLAEPIYGGGRNLKVEYPRSPAPDGLQLAVADVTGSAGRMLREHRGGTVLWVGHSNTLPQLVRELSGKQIEPIPEDDYGEIYVLSVPRFGAASLVRLKY